MSGPSALDPIIRRVPSSGVALSHDERLVPVDPTTKQALRGRRWWGETWYYVVAANVDGRRIARSRLSSLTVRDGDDEISFTVEYAASCEYGREELVASALADTDAPHTVLARRLARWLAEYSPQHGLRKLLHDCFATPETVEKAIAARASRDAGLALQTTIRPDAAKALDTVVIDSRRVTMRSKDSTKARDVVVTAVLSVPPDGRALAVLNAPRSDELQSSVIAELQRFCRDDLTLQEYFFGLHTPDVRQRLIHALDRVLAPSGREVGNLSLAAHEPTPPKPFVEEQNRKVECKIRDYPVAVVVRNSVQMSMVDAAAYERAGTPPLESWLQEKLDHTIRDLLFDVTYTQILIDFEPMELAIKQRISDECRAIGYEVKHIVSVPDLTPFEWLEALQVDTGEIAYDTRLAGVQVKLQIVADVRVRALRDIAPYLNRQADVPGLLRQRIIQRARQLLHGVDPERFYLRFTYSDQANEPPVEEELRQAIEVDVLKKFPVDIVQVSPKVVDTELIARLKALMKQSVEFDVSVGSLHGGEPVRYRGQLQVEGVDAEGWNRFQLREATLDDIKRCFEDAIKGQLQMKNSTGLAFRDLDGHTGLKRAMVLGAGQAVRDLFGVRVDVPTFYRDLTGLEGELNQQITNQQFAGLRVTGAEITGEANRRILENEGRTQEIARLTEEILKRTGVAGEEEEVAQLKKTLETLMKPTSLKLPAFDDIKRRTFPALGEGNSDDRGGDKP